MTDMKKCPYCGEDVKLGAIKCRHCQTMLSEGDTAPVGAAATAKPQQAAPKVKKPIWKRWWVWVIVGLLVIGMFGGGNGNDEEVADEPEEQVEVVEEVTSVDEAKVYDGAFKFAGEAVVDVEGSDIRIDTSVSADDDGHTFTDIIVTEGMTDFEGNVFTPGIYEFQFVEFPEQTGQGSWYVYINEDIKISGNPNASDAGEEYELKEGDIVSVDFWTIATFYKVVK